MLKSPALCVSVAEEAVSHGKRKQSEWFVESAEEIKPLIERKNEGHKRLIPTNSAEARREFRQQQWLGKRAVDKMREGGLEEWLWEEKQL